MTSGTQEDVERWCRLKSGFSVGIVCGNVIGIDVDVYDPDVADACGRKGLCPAKPKSQRLFFGKLRRRSDFRS